MTDDNRKPPRQSFVLRAPDKNTWAYDDIVQISEEASANAGRLRMWTTTPVDDPDKLVRMCCGKEDETACNECHPPNCTISVPPLTGPTHISISHDAKHGGDELVFENAPARRIPILDADPAVHRAQLKRWHDRAFGAHREVHYHLYKVDAASLHDGNGKLVELHGKLIAIPVDPAGRH